MSAGQAHSLPADIQQVLDQIDEADRAADSLAGRLTDEQFHWQPDGGRGWSVAQCLEHLATINVVYVEAVQTGVETARRHGWSRSGPLSPGFFGRKFIASMQPPVTRRMRAPGRVRPGSQSTRDDILRRYHEAHERVRRTLHDAAGIDANRATFQNPFLKLVRVKVATGLQVIAAHDRRHLWQAEQVMNRTDFPKPR
jgi:hypothetical protein